MRTLQKRRSITTGLSLEDELKAWTMYFTTGHDYFHDLAILGIPRTHEAPRQAAEEAWERLGREFMRTWVPRPGRQEPWAVEQFGEPYD